LRHDSEDVRGVVGDRRLHPGGEVTMTDEPTLLGRPVRTTDAPPGAGGITFGTFAAYFGRSIAIRLLGDPRFEFWWRGGRIEPVPVFPGAGAGRLALSIAECDHLDALREFLR
jgi:hypothetical protein